MPEIILQKFANRELRVGIQDIRRPTRNYGDKAEQRQNTYEAKMFALSQASVVHGANTDYMVSRDPNFCAVLGKGAGEGQERRIQYALDITSEFQQTRKDKRSRKKQYDTDNRNTRFTSAARHRLLEAGAVAQKWLGSSGKGYFVTLTLPGSTTDAIRALARYSGYACNRLTQVIRRLGESPVWFYSWEWQKRGALHLHLYIAFKSSEHGLQACNDIVRTWYRTLDDIGQKSGVDLFLRSRGRGRSPRRDWQSDVREVTYGSAAAYISKYVGKGSKIDPGKGGFAQGKQLYYPARWWGMSRKLKEMTDEARLDIRITGLTDEEALRILETVDSETDLGGRIRSYSYEFELFRGRGSDRYCFGSGTRFIHYYNDDHFRRLEVWLPGIVRLLARLFPHARLEYRYGHPFADMMSAF